MKQIKFIDFSREYNFLKDKLTLRLNKVLSKGDFILGEELKNFENNFAKYIGVKYAIGVNSGTDALFLSLLSLGIKKGDEVIVPSFTYMATALAVSFTKAIPVFVDIEPDTYCIDPEDVEKKISKKTKAIIVVHLYGHPVNMNEILKLAKKYNLKIIEDCAQAHGAKWQMAGGRWQMVGAMGDLGCFSFYPTKNLGCYGDGGMIVTNSKKLYQRLLMLRDYGRISKYVHKEIGYNSRLDTLQAQILNLKLKYLDKWNERRRELAKYYNSLLRNLDNVVISKEKKGYKHVYHLYVIRVKKRDYILKQLVKNKIQVLIHYPLPCHLQPVYKNSSYKRGSLPISENISKEVLSLPLYPFLKKEEIERVVSILKRVL
jgi:dTDP-4-amino-4,6-dideoxygalactose transaminase